MIKIKKLPFEKVQEGEDVFYAAKTPIGTYMFSYREDIDKWPVILHDNSIKPTILARATSKEKAKQWAQVHFDKQIKSWVYVETFDIKNMSNEGSMLNDDEMWNITGNETQKE